MLDEHSIPQPTWGVKPILFSIFDINIPSYTFFILLALICGSIVYYLEAKKIKKDNEPTFFIALAALLGGSIGSKIPILLIHFQDIIHSPNISIIFSGKTIVGGLIGGTISVYFVKKYLKIKGKRGNIFTPAITLAMAIGRIGCFLRGCCYGIPTNLPWGVNFGDNIKRHPTQIYESFFWLTLFLYTKKHKKKFKSGELYKFTLTLYLTFRFFLEFIKAENKVFLNLTIYQLFIPLILLYLLREKLFFIIKKVYNKFYGK